jgi:adrenodoxin-NADP+ reductase
VVRGLYCAGWVKRGPVGIIDSSLRDASETFKVIKAHLDTDVLESKSTSVEEIR